MDDALETPLPEPANLENDVSRIQVEGFNRTLWLDEKLLAMEKLEPGEAVEFDLPADTDHIFFISELGKPSRDFEFGGVYNLRTRSVKMMRGYAAGERGAMSPAGINFIKPRINSDGKTTDDIFFHTHPWKEKDAISYFNVPKNSCKPIGSDIDNVMAVRMIEEEDGLERTVVSVIGSRGFVSLTESTGINVDDDILIQAQISKDQRMKIKEFLAIVPPFWIKNYSKDESSPDQLVNVVKDFYAQRRSDRDTSYSEKAKAMRDKIADLIEPRSLNSFMETILGHLPKYPTTTYLQNIGLNAQQIELVQQLSGIRVETSQVVEGNGLVKVE